MSDDLILLEEAAALDRGEVVLTLKDEVICNIQGLEPYHRKALVDEWAITVAGAFFMPAYKTGAWDGKIQYFKPTGNTYINLLDKIVPRIVDYGYKITIIDKRPLRAALPAQIDQNIFQKFGVTLRYYQVDAANAGLSHGNGILNLATGAGKTYINAAISQAHHPLRSFTIVPNTDLVIQTAETFNRVELDTGVFYGKKKLLDHQHIIGTWQSLKNNPDILKDFGVILVDEVHGAKAGVLFKLLTELPGAKIQYRYGMTGTIPKAKSDKTSIKAALGPVRYTLKAKQLMDEGFISNLDIVIIQLQDCFIQQMSWDAEKAFLARNTHRYAAMAELINTVSKQGNTLVLVNSIKAGETLVSFIPDSVFLSGKDKNETRKEHYDSFDTEDHKVVIATYGIAQAGLDIERIFNLIPIDAGKAFTRVIQTIGRGLRKAADKHHVNVMDICSNGKYSEKHMKDRISYYKDAKYPYRVEKMALDSKFDELN